MNRNTILLIAIFAIISCNSKSDHATISQGKQATLKKCIAYNVLVDPLNNNYDIHITDLEGKDHINISNNESLDWVYSSYGNHLYAISDRDTCKQCYFLYETDIHGSKWRKVSNTQVQDSWIDSRNNGEQLIIKPIGKPNTPFQIIDRRGKVITELNTGMEYANDPCFSADGRSIIYRGYSGSDMNATMAELYQYDMKTKANKKLTNYPKDGKTFGNYQYHAGPPRWNNKTNVISYSSSSNGTSVIKSVTPKGEAKRKLTQHNVKAVWHDISSDGEWMVFDGQLDFKADSNTTQIFITNYKTRNTKSITRGNGYKQGPVFIDTSDE